MYNKLPNLAQNCYTSTDSIDKANYFNAHRSPVDFLIENFYVYERGIFYKWEGIFIIF